MSSKGFLVCDKCKNYYELQHGESPEDFVNECDCGGTLRYAENLEGVEEDFAASEATITCPECGTENPEDTKLCKSCKRLFTQTPPKTDKTPEKNKKRIFAWWNQQSTPIKVGIIIGVCLIGLILIFAIGGMFSTPNTTTITPNTTTTTQYTPSSTPTTNTTPNSTNTTPTTTNPTTTPTTTASPNTISSTPTQSPTTTQPRAI